MLRAPQRYGVKGGGVGNVQHYISPSSPPPFLQLTNSLHLYAVTHEMNIYRPLRAPLMGTGALFMFKLFTGNYLRGRLFDLK